MIQLANTVFFCLYKMATKVGFRADEAAVGAEMCDPSSGSLACHCTGWVAGTLCHRALWLRCRHGLGAAQTAGAPFGFLFSCPPRSQSSFVVKLNTLSTPRRHCHKNPAVKTKCRIKIWWSLLKESAQILQSFIMEKQLLP